MKTRIIRAEDLARLMAEVDMDQVMENLIDRLTLACAEFDHDVTQVRIRDGFHYFQPNVGLIEWMPVMRAGHKVTIKTVGYHPANPGKEGLPSVLSTVGMWDTHNGHLVGLADGVFLTALRTGAASAVASRILAHPQSRVLGLIGAGAQAVTQLHALLCCFPIERVLVFDTDQAAQASLADRVATFTPEHVEIRSAPIDLLVQSSDILCTATSIDVGTGPLFEDMETRPGLHVNAVGADFAGKTELPKSLLERAIVCPDYAEQAAIEGECQQLRPEQVGPDLVELVKRQQQVLDWRDQLTVFDSTGFALEDDVAMEVLIEYCDQLGLGLELDLEAVGDDPLDPYSFGTATTREVPARKSSA